MAPEDKPFVWFIRGAGVARKVAEEKARRVPNSPYSLLLERGKQLASRGSKWSPGFFQPAERGCFLNAQYAVMNRVHLRYFEGLAANGPASAVQHAWVVDERDEILDCTPGWGFTQDYFGIEFSRSQILASFEKHGCYGDSLLFSPPPHGPKKD